jgi:hypothetical protein
MMRQLPMERPERVVFRMRDWICGLLPLFAMVVSIAARGEIVSDVSELRPGTRVSRYMFSEEQMSELYKVGVYWDKKLGIQLDCNTQYQVHPKTLALIQRVDLPEDKSHPVKGVWRHRFAFERCGEIKTYNAIFVAKNGEKPQAHPYFPGETNASPLLVLDAMVAAYVTAIGKRRKDGDGQECKDLQVADMAVVEQPHDVAEGGAVLRQIWKERWTFSGCGSTTTVIMTFTPDGKGGTSFSASGN